MKLLLKMQIRLHCDLSRDMYTKEACCQVLPTSDTLSSWVSQLKEMLLVKRPSWVKENDWISSNKYEFLYNKNPRMASFYVLPKIHKCAMNPPGRPVVSGNDSLIEPI